MIKILCDETKKKIKLLKKKKKLLLIKLKLIYYDKIQIETELKMWEKNKTQMVEKIKYPNCDKTPKLKLC